MILACNCTCTKTDTVAVCSRNFEVGTCFVDVIQVCLQLGNPPFWHNCVAVTSRAMTHRHSTQHTYISSDMWTFTVCRELEAVPRSSLSPAGNAPSASPHCATTQAITPQQPKALRVRVVTFNMNFKAPTEVPDELLGRAGCPEGLKKYDIVVVGTQESGPLQVISFIRVSIRMFTLIICSIVQQSFLCSFICIHNFASQGCAPARYSKIVSNAVRHRLAWNHFVTPASCYKAMHLTHAMLTMHVLLGVVLCYNR